MNDIPPSAPLPDEMPDHISSEMPDDMAHDMAADPIAVGQALAPIGQAPLGQARIGQSLAGQALAGQAGMPVASAAVAAAVELPHSVEAEQQIDISRSGGLISTTSSTDMAIGGAGVWRRSLLDGSSLPWACLQGTHRTREGCDGCVPPIWVQSTTHRNGAVSVRLY